MWRFGSAQHAYAFEKKTLEVKLFGGYLISLSQQLGVRCGEPRLWGQSVTNAHRTIGICLQNRFCEMQTRGSVS